MQYMPTVMTQLVGQGMLFTNYYVTTALCCPSRSSFFTGLYAHDHKVRQDGPPLGGYQMFNDTSTLALWLHNAGYMTSMMGKYLNEYNQPFYIPPGWDDWHVFSPEPNYNNYNLTENGVLHYFGNRPDNYSTDVLVKRALNFIQNAPRPFFLDLAVFAPHYGFVVDKQDIGTCGNIAMPIPPSFNESDVGKPKWVKAQPIITITELATMQKQYQNYICTLKAVDRGVASIITTLGPELSNTVIIYTSDNGILWGEHRFTFKKGNNYEESIHMPLIIRFPPLIPSPMNNTDLTLNIDLAPTIADLAGVAVPTPIDGMSLVPIIKNSNAPWRNDILLEFFRTKYAVDSGVRTSQFKYLETGETGEEEFYDLSLDPYELHNQIMNSSYATTIAYLRSRLAQLMTVQNNLVLNSGFEANNFTCGVQPLRWSATPCTSSSAYGQTSDSHSGHYALTMWVNSGTAAPRVTQSVYPIVNNITYVLRLYAKTPSQSSVVVSINLANTKTIASCIYRLNQTWTPYSCTFKSQSASTVNLVVISITEYGSTGSIIVDDVSVQISS